MTPDPPRPPRHRGYWWTFAGLLALLAATIVAAYLPLGAAAPFVAYGMAALKTLLVALFFMHLAHRGGVTRLFAFGGLVWLAILFTLTFADYFARGGRGDHPASSRSWSETATPAGAPAPLPEGRPAVRRVVDTGTSASDK